MKKWIIIILMLLMMQVTLANVDCEVSKDNGTWTNITSTIQGGCLDETINLAYIQNLYNEDNNTWHIRCKNESTDWGYVSVETLESEGGINEMILVVGLIFMFLTGLLVYGLSKTQSLTYQVILAGGLSFMIMTLLRLASWFVHIDEPSELELINTLDHYYMFGLWGFRLVLIAAIFIVIIIILNAMDMRKKNTKNWENWGNE